MPFAEGMTRPRIDTAALLADLQCGPARGMLIIRCNVYASGLISDCEQVKPLPIVGPELARRLELQRAEPATLDGKPVSIRYVFVFKIEGP